MGVIPVEYVGREDYLTQAAQSPIKLEYENGEVVAMAGTTTEHNRICLNVASALERVAKPGCQVFAMDVRVEAAESKSYFYPDALLVCGPLLHNTDNPPSLLNPSIIVEVLSASNSVFVMLTKLDAYKAIPSVIDILYIDSTSYQVRVYSRRADGWDLSAYINQFTDVPLPGSNLVLPMAAIYKGLVYNPGSKLLELVQP